MQFLKSNSIYIYAFFANLLKKQMEILNTNFLINQILQNLMEVIKITFIISFLTNQI